MRSVPLCLILVSLIRGVVVAETIEMVVASVDGEPVTLGDLRRFMLAQGESVPANLLIDRESSRALVREVVTRMLLEKEAEAQGISVSDKEVDAYIEEIKRQNGGVDDAGLAELLKSRGLTLDEYRKQIVGDILRMRVVGAKVRQKVTVLEEDIDRYIAEHEELKPQYGQVRLEQIFLPVDEGDPARQREMLWARAEEMRRRIADGERFSAVGREAYEDLGYVTVSDLLPELRAAVETKKKGEVTEIIENTHGIYLLRVASDMGKPDLPVELREEIRSRLFQEKLKKELEQYLTEDLQNQHEVEIKM